MTFCQLLPPSRVRRIRPSSVPTQIWSAASGDGAIVEMVPKPQARARASVRSPVAQSGVPAAPAVAPERSGLTVRQLAPPSSERKSTWAPR